MKEPYRKGNSESILALSLADGIARCRVKRRQRYRWAGLLSFEKPMDRDADSVPVGRKATRQPRYREGLFGPAQSENPRTLRNNMHENREISCTSWSDDQGRSAKAINRTADMNVQEKSDCAVVPVNQSNKEERSSAETGEGRAQTAENIAIAHASDTERET